MFKIPARFEHRPFGPALPGSPSVLGLAGLAPASWMLSGCHWMQSRAKYNPKKYPLFRRASLEQLGSALMRYWVQSRRWLAGAQAVPNSPPHGTVQSLRIVAQVPRYGLPAHSEVLAQFVG